MAEKGNLILPQAGGNVIATRDGVELDDIEQTRLIPLVDFSTKGLPSPMGVATRSGITGADTRDLSLIPADITDNLITCGDASTLVVFTEFATITGGWQEARIIPLIFDDEASPNVMFALENQLVESYSTTPYRGTGPLQILGPRVSWNILGASQIGLLVSSATIHTTASLWGYVV